MAVTPNKKFAILQRRQQVADLYLQGWTQTAIAERLSARQGTISHDLKAIRQQWRESTLRDFDEAQGEELHKIDRVEREAWSAWDRSQKPSQSVRVNGVGDGQQTQKNVQNRHGDARLLEIVLKCSAARRTLLSLDPPTRIAPVMPNGKEPYRLAVSHMTDSELRTILRVTERQLALTHEPESEEQANEPSNEAESEVRDP